MNERHFDADALKARHGELGALAVLRALGVDTDAGTRSGDNLNGLRLPPDLGNDTNPSVSVDLARWLVNDHGGDFSGTLFQLVQEARRCDFPGAVRFAAEACGERLTDYSSASKPQASPAPARAETLAETLATFERAPWKHGRVTARYDYHDADGVLVFQVERFEPTAEALAGAKTFRQRRPDAGGRWVRHVRDLSAETKATPYRLPDVLEAVARGEALFIVEGEKDAEALAALGFAATCNAGGAGKWSAAHAEHLTASGLPSAVYVLPDADAPGVRHALDVARTFAALGVPVRIAEPFGPPGSKRDTSDALADGLTPEALREHAEAGALFTGEPHAWAEAYLGEGRDDATGTPSDASAAPGADLGSSSEAEEGERERRPTAAVRLIELVEAVGGELWHDVGGTPFVTLRARGFRETHRIRSTDFRRYLQRLFFESEGRTPPAQGLEDGLGTLEGQALFNGAEHQSAVRIAETETDGVREVWLDLCDESWNVIRVSPGGWSVVPSDACPVRFERRRHMLPLASPVSPKDVGRTVPDVLAEFGALVNLQPGTPDFVLVLGWLVQALRGAGPYPLLGISGEQGSGKSSISKRLRALIDPNQAPLRSLPRNEQELFISASSAHVLCFDNVSGLSDRISDSLCRLATGGGLSVRELYTTDGERVFDAQRPCILNGITDVVSRQDLAERTLAVSLRRIPPENRRSEAELNAAFDARLGLFFGALLDAAGAGLAELPDVHLDRLPRLADFAVWATACERGLGLEDGDFLRAFDAGRASLVEATLEGEPVAEALRALLATERTFEGSASELLDALATAAGYGENGKRPPKTWPGAPHVLSGTLRRLAPALREVGFSLEWSHTSDRSKRRVIEVRYAPANAPRASASPQQEKWRKQASEAPEASDTPQTGRNRGLSSDASDARGHRASDGASDAKGPIRDGNGASDASDASDATSRSFSSSSEPEDEALADVLAAFGMDEDDLEEETPEPWAGDQSVPF